MKLTLAKTIQIRAGKLSVKDRAQPLTLAPHTYLIAVVRIETGGTVSEPQLARTCSGIICSALRPGVSGIQIDFDARRSEREWYRLLIGELKSRLRNDVFFSMTSLASWCLGDDWLQGLPVDEVVPMFFSMGADHQHVAVLLESGRTYNHKYKAIGISDDEPIINNLLGKSEAGILMPSPRVYMFSHTCWSFKKAQRLIKEVSGWR